MLFVIILHDCSDIKQNIDSFIFNGLFRIIKQHVKHLEDLTISLILLNLRALFLNELNQWNELVQ